MWTHGHFFSLCYNNCTVPLGKLSLGFLAEQTEIRTQAARPKVKNVTQWVEKLALKVAGVSDLLWLEIKVGDPNVVSTLSRFNQWVEHMAIVSKNTIKAYLCSPWRWGSVGGQRACQLRTRKSGPRVFRWRDRSRSTRTTSSGRSARWSQKSREVNINKRLNFRPDFVLLNGSRDHRKLSS